MTEMEFKTKLAKAFNEHSVMSGRNKHTVNELLYVLEHHPAFKDEDYNINVKIIDKHWVSVPTLDAFVNVKTRGVWFEDDKLEFEIDECEDVSFNCITVYECNK